MFISIQRPVLWIPKMFGINRADYLRSETRLTESASTRREKARSFGFLANSTKSLMSDRSLDEGSSEVEVVEDGTGKLVVTMADVVDVESCGGVEVVAVEPASTHAPTNRNPTANTTSLFDKVLS